MARKLRETHTGHSASHAVIKLFPRQRLLHLLWLHLPGGAVLRGYHGCIVAGRMKEGGSRSNAMNWSATAIETRELWTY